MIDKVSLLSQTAVDLGKRCLGKRGNKFLCFENVFKVVFMEYVVSVIMLKNF